MLYASFCGWRNFPFPAPLRRRFRARRDEKIEKSQQSESHARVCRAQTYKDYDDKEHNFLPMREKEIRSPRFDRDYYSDPRGGSETFFTGPPSSAYIHRPLLPLRFIKVSTADASCLHIYTRIAVARTVSVNITCVFVANDVNAGVRANDYALDRVVSTFCLVEI